MKRVSESEWKKGLSSPRLAQPGCNQQRVCREGQRWPLQCRSDKRGDIVRPRPYVSFSFSFSLPLSFPLVFLLPFFTRERTRGPVSHATTIPPLFHKAKIGSVSRPRNRRAVVWWMEGTYYLAQRRYCLAFYVTIINAMI